MGKRLMQLTSFVLVMGLVLASVVEADLVGWWKFEESGGTLEDSSGQGNNGTFNGNLYQQPGVAGYALGFDGTDDRFSFANNGWLTDTFSFGGWLKTTATHETDAESIAGVGGVNGQRYAFDPAHGGQTNGGAGLSVGTNGISVYEHGGGYMPVLAGYEADIGDDWNHIMVVYNNKRPTLYLNGEAVRIGLSSPRATVNAPFRIGGMTYGYFEGLMDEIQIYSRALTSVEVQSLVGHESATNPSPADELGDTARDSLLSWSALPQAGSRNVYFGTVWDDVNDAVAGSPLNVSAGQTETTFDPGRLDFGQTYYWRVDEVNATPDRTVFKGNVWSFTVEPLAYPITAITATASSTFGDSVPENTINGSGLVDDLHGRDATHMWISGGVPASIEYAFDRAHKLHELWVWNSNQTIEAFIGFGAKDVVIEHSLDGENWTVLDGVGPLAQGPGAEGYAHNNTIAFNGAAAQYVRITVNTVQGFAPQASLSEVRFFSIPTTATRPSPDSGVTDVAPDVTLAWGRNGREAGRHDVYLGTDASDLSLAGSVTESHFDTLASDLQLGQTYHWQVVEVNDAMDPSEWAGAIWNFTTASSIVVDGMESYRDEEFFEIWATWIDGFDDPANGALVGNGVSGSPEEDTVHSGRQSLPLHYGNGGAADSEATRTFAAAQDWNMHGVQSLVLSFQGTPSNTGGTFYIKIDDTKLAYDGDTASLMRGGWNKWVILLGDLSGVNLSNVRSLTLGVEGGGDGVVYVDDITLTPVGQRDLVTPTEPGGGLVLHLPFDGDYQDVSGNGRHGTPMGGINPAFEAGHLGQAVSFDGIDQYVAITGYQGILAVDDVQQPFTIANWVNTTSAAGDTEMVTWGLQGAATRVTWRVHQGRLRTEHAAGNLRGNTYINDGEWHHVALTVTEGAILRPEMTQLYVDGREDTYFSGADVAYNIAAGSDVNVGRSGPQNGRYFIGSIDDVRIYDYHLSAAEVAWLAGRTAAFDR